IVLLCSARVLERIAALLAGAPLRKLSLFALPEGHSAFGSSALPFEGHTNPGRAQKPAEPGPPAPRAGGRWRTAPPRASARAPQPRKTSTRRAGEWRRRRTQKSTRRRTQLQSAPHGGRRSRKSLAPPCPRAPPARPRACLRGAPPSRRPSQSRRPRVQRWQGAAAILRRACVRRSSRSRRRRARAPPGGERSPRRDPLRGST
ncbi:hypothetical protein T492DRAFT_1140190, partial [Pavlovales sp. CCMP2436]